MPAHPMWTAFVTGEISERLAARIDFQKYGLAAFCLRNFIVQPHGGIAKRPGSVFLGQTKYNSLPVRLVRFVFSADEAYMLEFGHLYIRVWRNRQLLRDENDAIVELVTPYEAGHLRDLRMVQSADVMWIFHQSYEPRRLIRTSATSFTFRTVNFKPGPTWEQPVEPQATLSLSGTTGSITATLSAPYFLPGDKSRGITAEFGRAVITAVVSTTVVQCEVQDPFDTVGPFAAGDWQIDGSPNYMQIDPVGPIQPVGGTITIHCIPDAPNQAADTPS